MSAHLSDSHALASDAIEDFFGFSLEAIHALQNELREARERLNQRDKEVALLEAALERERRNRLGRRAMGLSDG